MGHWIERYLGLPYLDTFDCGHLVQKILREEFGKEVEFPARMAPDMNELTGSLKEHKDEFAKETDNPVDGDCVLMKSGPHWHIGLYFKAHNEDWVIHNSRAAGQTVVNRVRELNKSGLKLLGYYEWLNG